jgi:PAP2 superfamily
LLDDGFAAFPSGHSSFSWAGLLYLSLWLCLRFSVSIPYLRHTTPTTHKDSEDLAWVRYARTKKAAPPLWLAAVSLAPIFVAIFISASRYADFHHAGIDIFAGCFIGIVLAWTSFRMYHLPLRRGYGFSWGNRSAHGAFSGDFMERHVQDGHTGRAGVMDEEASVGRRTQSSVAGEEMIPYSNRGTPAEDMSVRPMPYSTIAGR